MSLSTVVNNLSVNCNQIGLDLRVYDPFECCGGDKRCTWIGDKNGFVNISLYSFWQSVWQRVTVRPIEKRWWRKRLSHSIYCLICDVWVNEWGIEGVWLPRAPRLFTLHFFHSPLASIGNRHLDSLCTNVDFFAFSSPRTLDISGGLTKMLYRIEWMIQLFIEMVVGDLFGTYFMMLLFLLLWHDFYDSKKIEIRARPLYGCHNVEQLTNKLRPDPDCSAVHCWTIY